MLFAAVALALVVQLSLVGGASTDSGTTVKQIKSVGSFDEYSTTSETYVNLPGAVATVTVPNGQQGVIIARFTGQSECIQAPPVDNVFCLVRVTIDGVPQQEIVFESVVASQGGDSSHSYETANTVGPGTHTVRVQYRLNHENSKFGLANWRLTVERIQK